MNKLIYKFSAFILIVCLANQAQAQNFQLKDSDKELEMRRKSERAGDAILEKKIDSLLAIMTIEEKVGQMIQIAVDFFSEIKEYDETSSGITEVKIDSSKFMSFLTKYPIGSIINGYGFAPENWYNFEMSLQKMNQRHTRLGIPIIHSADHQHGANYVHGATIFPHSLNMAATFNRELVAAEARVVSAETAELGHRWILGPIADLGCNPGWPRIFETFGEDPYLTTEMVNVYMDERLKSEKTAPYKQASCAKHFIGYSNPTGIWDRTPSDISMQTLWEYHIPSFKAVIDKGVNGVMLNSGELNGEAVHTSYRLVTQLLRDKLNFKGVVITDWDDIDKAWKYHKVAKNAKEATLLALNAGIDMTMSPDELEFGDFILEFIEEGKVSEERIDLSVSRIMRMKLQTGLFEAPLPRKEGVGRIGQKENKEKALQASRESIVMLKNNKVLPLKKKKKVVLAGPNANIKRSLTGGWTYRWNPVTDEIFPKEMKTFYQALKENYATGSVILSDKEKLTKDAEKADIIFLALGEGPHAEGLGNINDILLPKDQKQLLEAAIKTGKPVVVVMIGARPLIATELFDKCKAFIWAGLAGTDAGQAISEIITGKVNPSGKMAFSYPAYSGHYYNYNHKPSHTNYDIPVKNERILFAEFGDGLSYSDFEYSKIELSDSIIDENGSVEARVYVTNTSKMSGKEAVLWYLTDEVASITRPVKQLKHFEKKELSAGETQKFIFRITKDDLKFVNDRGDEILEAGYFTIWVGDKKEKLRLRIN